MLILNAKRLTLNAKRLIIFLVIFSLLSAFSIKHSASIYSQTQYEKAKSDYSAQLKKYNEAKDAYVTAKSNYSAFKTATAKTDAFIKTKEYLTQANFLLVNYLFVAKEFGNQIHWENSNFSKEATLKPIDDEVNFLQDNWRKIQAASKLEDLPPTADELSKHLDNSTVPVVNRVGAIFEVVKIEYMLVSFNQVSQKLIGFVTPRIKADSKPIINNWQSEIDVIKKAVDTHLSLAKSDLEKVKADGPNGSQVNKVLESTDLAKAELLKSRNLFEEILRII